MRRRSSRRTPSRLIGADADVDGVDDFAATDVVDAEDFGVGDGDVLEGGVLADVGSQLA